MTATGPNSVEAAGPSSSGSMLVFNQVRPDVGGAHWGGYDLQKEPFLFFHWTTARHTGRDPSHPVHFVS